MIFIGIPYREAIPVRAIPFAAGSEGFPRTPRLPPSALAQAMHQACDDGSTATPVLRPLVLQAGKPTPVDLMYLDAVAPLSDFPQELDEPIRDSFSRLPPGMFVFADDLRQFMDWLFPPGAWDGQCREPIEIATKLELPESVNSTIYEGFDGFAEAPLCDKTKTTHTPSLAGLSKQEILANDWPIPSTINLKDILSDVPKWLEPARVSRGAAGKYSALWNPAMLAFCLASTKAISKTALTRHISRFFAEWADEWERLSDSI